MKNNGCIVVIVLFLLFFAGCVSPTPNQNITVINLDTEGFVQDPVGNFEVYTGSFQIANPTNLTFENVDVDITLLPTATYCHGVTKTFHISRLIPSETKTVEISTAEFANIDCQYDYSYQVFLQKP
ncbi:MAG: hypothetical protein CVV34_02985 [Methanomicrobiales archaeon HGW-Methanomicrobiales-5]|nr:MAG: hypothetical protein CVV34_02985 [Methanomicrobiales archaeon HGW-Methanomicrobiales-5]